MKLISIIKIILKNSYSIISGEILIKNELELNNDIY